MTFRSRITLFFDGLDRPSCKFFEVSQLTGSRKAVTRIERHKFLLLFFNLLLLRTLRNFFGRLLILLLLFNLRLLSFLFKD